MAGISAILSGVKRVVKVLPDLVLGNGAEVAGKAIKTTIKNKGSIFQAAKEGIKATEKLSVAASGAKIGFFTRITSNIGSIAKLTKAGAKLGAKKGIFASIVGGTKGFFKGLGKNMPLIGALMTIAFEIPNVVKASKEQGIGQGIKEVAKAGARLAGGGIGAAFGSAICPGIGTCIGWMVGEWLTSKVVGKTYSEKVAQAEYEAQLAAEQAAATQQQVQVQPQVPFQGNPYQQQPQVQYQEPVDYYRQAEAQAQSQMQPQVTQPSFQGNPYPEQQSALSNPFAQQQEFNNLTNLMGGSTLNSYSKDIFAQNINFEQLAANMTNGIIAQNQMAQQPLQMQPQVSMINP